MRIDQYDRIVCLAFDGRYPDFTDRTRDQIAGKGGKMEIFLSGLDHVDRIGRELYHQINDFEPPASWGSRYRGAWYHLMVFKTVVREARRDGLRNLLIVEDDLEFTPEFDAIMAKVVVPEDWHLLYYGALHQWATTTEVSDHLLRLDGSVGSHCLGINSTAFDAVLGLADDNFADSLLREHLHPTWNAYGIYPSVAITTPCVSSITGEWSGYPCLWESRGRVV